MIKFGSSKLLNKTCRYEKDDYNNTIFKNSKPEGIKTVNVHIMQDINSNIQFACLLGKYAFM